MYNKSIEQDPEFIFTLIRAVKSNFHRTRTIKSIVDCTLFELNIDSKSMIRRNHDGCTEAEWLIEKMIGEFLIDGEIKD